LLSRAAWLPDENISLPLRLSKAACGNLNEAGGCGVSIGLSRRGLAMLDVVFVAATLAFFGLAILYVRGCDRLK